MKMPKIEVWKNAAGEWQWHLKGANGEIMAVGEGYKRKSSAIAGAKALVRNVAKAKIVVY